MPGERLIRSAGFPALAYFRAGRRDRPLIVFLPGAGFLARVAYGHPGGVKPDFLDHWLALRGYPLLALSYPTDHPTFDRLYPAMTVRDWGESAAHTTATQLQAAGIEPQRPIILLAWSMAGRVVRAYNVATTRLGLNLECCVSLAASAPIPGMIPRSPDGEPLTAAGLWEVGAPLPRGRGRRGAWLAELAAIAKANGREVISEVVCRDFYWANTPIQLRGESQRIGADSRMVDDLAGALADLGTLSFGDFPVTAAIVPKHPIDARHALTDSATWAFFNAHKIFQTWLTSSGGDPASLSAPAWQELRTLMLDLPNRLTRSIDGGHFFFIGEIGARQTVEHIADLAGEARSIRRELSELTNHGR
ncbi:MAG: hypothetical protein HY058_21185 [Proteobacteria bacterium]|nr:hypothetical protein [Pseudomonadota bacterium]